MRACEQIRALAPLMRAVLGQENLCVIGNEQKIREDARSCFAVRERWCDQVSSAASAARSNKQISNKRETDQTEIDNRRINGKMQILNPALRR